MKMKKLLSLMNSMGGCLTVSEIVERCCQDPAGSQTSFVLRWHDGMGPRELWVDRKVAEQLCEDLRLLLREEKP